MKMIRAFAFAFAAIAVAAGAGASAVAETAPAPAAPAAAPASDTVTPDSKASCRNSCFADYRVCVKSGAGYDECDAELTQCLTDCFNPLN